MKTMYLNHFFFLYIFAIGSNGSTGGVHLVFFQFLGSLLYKALKSLPYLILYLSLLKSYTFCPWPYASDVLPKISFESICLIYAYNYLIF